MLLVDAKALLDTSGLSNFAAINIENFLAVDEFKEHMNQLIKQIKECPPVDGQGQVYLPGEMAYIKENELKKGGIPLPVGVIEELQEISQSLGISFNLSV
ncbi:MAG: Ldh family oxidoreductase [Peptococcaceae bacterium]